MRIAWMIERRLSDGKDWIPHKLAGRAFGYITRARAREEAKALEEIQCIPWAWRYRAIGYRGRRW